VPVQSRSERRVASFLFHAEAVIAEVGYEAATMTEIAARADASIGSLYQYFPNKETITAAVFRRYFNELVTRWATLSTQAEHLSPGQIAAQIIDQFVEFANEQPAFFPILNAPGRPEAGPGGARPAARAVRGPLPEDEPPPSAGQRPIRWRLPPSAR
jgi:AcrR family transcriptional regulator